MSTIPLWISTFHRTLALLGSNGRAPLVALLAFSAACASSLNAQEPIPVREVSSIERVSAATFRSVFSVMPLSRGQLLINDGRGRQIILVDSSLTRATVVIDSAPEKGPAYGEIPVPLIRYGTSSVLFVDRRSETLVLIDSTGAIGRTMAAPKTSDIPSLSSSASYVDAVGQLFYRGKYPVKEPIDGQLRGLSAMLSLVDSAPIIRANFKTGTVDTVANVRMPNAQRAESRTNGADSRMVITINPLVTSDEWTLLSDGQVAIVRGQDYHVDFLNGSNGSRHSSAKLPFAFKRLTEVEKQQLLDSAKSVLLPRAAANTPAQPATGVRVRTRGGTAMVPPETGLPLQFDFVMAAASEVGDYLPSVRPGAAMADFDGNLWILPNTSNVSRAGELVYDVVNGGGKLHQRVRMPAGRSVAGFGPGGVLFLMSSENNRWIVERAKIR